jgi:hypothetical protein
MRTPPPALRLAAEQPRNDGAEQLARGALAVIESGGHQSIKLQSAVRIRRRTAQLSRSGLKRKIV